MKQEVFKAYWKLYTVFAAFTLVLGSFLVYYLLFFAPKLNVSNFLAETGDKFIKTRDNVLYLESTVNDWSNYIVGDMTAKTAKLNDAKKSFIELKNVSGNPANKEELKEISKILTEYSNKSIYLLDNILTISEYFKRVEKAGVAYSSLNVQAASVDDLKKLVLDFKSISENSLADLEKIEASESLLGVDKDYKDLLRQYIESANLLYTAVEQNNTTEITKVSKNSDEAVSAISRQLSADLDTFVKDSNMVQDITLIKKLKLVGEEKTSNLKDRYKI